MTTDFIRDGHTPGFVRRPLCRPSGSLPPPQPPVVRGRSGPAPRCPPPSPTGQTSAPGLPGPASCLAHWRLGTALSLQAGAETEARAPRPRGPGPCVLCSGVSVSANVSSCRHVAPQTPQDSLRVSLASPWHSRCKRQFLLTRLAGPPNPGGQASRLPGLWPQPGQPEAWALREAVRVGGQEEVGAGDTTSPPRRT